MIQAFSPRRHATTGQNAFCLTMEETISRETIYRGRVLNLRVDRVRLPGQRDATREIVVHRGAVAIVALDADYNVLLIRQYRHAVERELVEIPAGTLEPGEDPAHTAARELEEETGYRAQHWEKLGYYFPSPGYTTEAIHLYLALNLSRVEHPRGRDWDEHIAPLWVPFSRAREMIAAGEIVASPAIIGLAWAREWLQRHGIGIQ
jgi:ADP-ribose pyrophosphatase